MEFIVIGDHHYPMDGEDAQQIVSAWVRARVSSLRDVQAGWLSADRYRADAREFTRRARRGDTRACQPEESSQGGRRSGVGVGSGADA